MNVISRCLSSQGAITKAVVGSVVDDSELHSIQEVPAEAVFATSSIDRRSCSSYDPCQVGVPLAVVSFICADESANLRVICCQSVNKESIAVIK